MVLIKMIMFTMTLKALSAGACAVVAGSLFHNLTVLGKNGKACWSILEWGCSTCDLCDIV